MGEKLERLLEAEVRGAGFELYHWQLIPGGRRRILRIFLHAREGGVNLDDCARVSRRLGPAIEAADAIQGAYALEVSTPGVDRPLIKPWHYESALGEKAALLVEDAEGGKRRLEGRLVAVEGDGVVLDLGESREKVALASIVKARLIPDLKMRKA